MDYFLIVGFDLIGKGRLVATASTLAAFALALAILGLYYEVKKEKGHVTWCPGPDLNRRQSGIQAA